MIVALLALSLVIGPAVAAEPDVVCRFTDDRLTEISGMALSRQHPDVLWIHNDSSGGPYLYAVNASTCQTLARIEVRGIEARDLEGMAVGEDARGRSVIWLGDIGDNRDSWPYVWVHRIREPPVIEDRIVRARTFRVTYPGGPLNAETLLADPNSPQVWLATKQLARGGLYALPDPLKRGVLNEAVRIGEEGPLVTDGAIAPSGTQYVLRDYVNAMIYRGLPPGEPIQTIDLPIQIQGEAITWSADERSLLVTSERDNRLIRVPIPNSSEVDDVNEQPPPVALPDPVEAPAESSSSMWWFIPIILLPISVIFLAEMWRRRGRSADH